MWPFGRGTRFHRWNEMRKKNNNNHLVCSQAFNNKSVSTIRSHCLCLCPTVPHIYHIFYWMIHTRVACWASIALPIHHVDSSTRIISISSISFQVSKQICGTLSFTNFQFNNINKFDEYKNSILLIESHGKWGRRRERDAHATLKTLQAIPFVWNGWNTPISIRTTHSS